MVNEIKKIVATINYGRLLWGKYFILILFNFIISLLIPTVTITILILVSKNMIIWEPKIILTLILANIFSIFLFSVSLSILIIDKKKKKKISLMLKDAIKLNAFVKRKPITQIGENPYRVSISFKFNDLLKEKVSPNGNIFVGYSKTYLKYVNQNIEILFSPKYDEVMFLKD